MEQARTHSPLNITRAAVWLIGGALSASQVVSQESAAPSSASKIVEAALFRATQKVRYDPEYVVIDYPGGDVPADTGVCTDVVIRTYRAALGVDLQKLVHEDMKQNFSSYPKNWGLRRPDKNIDHRRVPNLQRFFKRRGAELSLSEESKFLPGDLVAWDLNGKGLWHIGVVVGNNEFVHNIGGGPVRERAIREWKVIGHYRYLPAASKAQSPRVLKKPTSKIAAFLKKYRKGPHDIDLSQLTVDPEDKRPNEPKQGASIDSYSLPTPKGSSDYFHYTVLHDRKTNEIKVVVSGGIAGIYKVYRLN